jgi:hypothetical protein
LLIIIFINYYYFYYWIYYDFLFVFFSRVFDRLCQIEHRHISFGYGCEKYILWQKVFRKKKKKKKLIFKTIRLTTRSTISISINLSTWIFIDWKYFVRIYQITHRPKVFWIHLFTWQHIVLTARFVSCIIRNPVIISFYFLFFNFVYNIQENEKKKKERIGKHRSEPLWGKWYNILKNTKMK